MTTKIFVNLPVKDLNKSVTFFQHLGFTFDHAFTNENATCMIVGENIFVMLLVENFFKTFTKKPVVDAHKATEAIICLYTDTREEVDEMVTKALEAGGSTPIAKQDQGFLYAHGFEDLEGHLWEVMHMDIAAFKEFQKQQSN